MQIIYVHYDRFSPKVPIIYYVSTGLNGWVEEMSILYQRTQRTTDTQRELFFQKNELLGLSRHFERKFFGVFRVFSA